MYKNYLSISMFPYPSGNLHLGHLRNYIINDIINRWNRFNFLLKSPFFMGWDCFGTPAENVSINKKIYPSLWIKKNIFNMKFDLNISDIKIVWKNEIFTYKKKFYFINNYFLIFFLKKKFIYLDNKIVNWDSCEKTILSNEQVVSNKGWRSGCKIKKINFLTYYIKLTYYKEELLYELNNLNWPKTNKIIQKNWINKIKGFLFIYSLTYFFKNIDLLIFFNKLFFFNNFFFIYFYNLFFYKFLLIFFNFKKILKKKNFFKNLNFINLGFLIFNTYDFNLNELFIFYFEINKKSNKFILNKNINIDLFYISFLKNDFFNKFCFFYKNLIYNFINWNLSDWGVSRQKYWGSPIFSYNCKLCKKKFFILNKKKLLPKNLKSSIKINVLKKNFYFSYFICNFCNNFSFSEFETLDTFFDSSWYFFFYFFSKNFFRNLNKWFPMNIYIGGIEHSNLHLLYSRFILKFLRDQKIILFSEPCLKLISQGIVLNHSYYRKINNKIYWYNIKDLYKKKKNNIFFFFSKIENKKILKGKVEKMSKSKNNGIIFRKIIKIYGISSLRLYIISFPIKNNFLWNRKIFLNFFINLKKFLKILYSLNKKFNYYYLNRETFISYNDKILFLFFNKNFKKIKNFYNLLNYNKIISIIFNFFNLLKKLNIKKFFLLNYFIFIYLKLIKPIIPLISIKFLNFLNYNKYFFKIFFYKIYLNLKINYLFIINKKKFFFFFIYKKKILKKKILNFIFFIYKFNKTILKFFLFKKIINILFKKCIF